MSILKSPESFEASVPVLIVGGGACGLIAALTVKAAGVDVVVLERDASPSGSTALSTGFIPACETRWQKAIGVEDSVQIMAEDVQAKNKGQGNPVQVDAVCRTSGPTLEWLADAHGIEFVLLDDFLYPGHRRHRMHAHPDRTGPAFIGSLLGAVERSGIDVMCDAHVTDLYADPAADANGRVTGVAITRPDGGRESIGCDALILACNGYGGNKEMLAKYIPEMADAWYFGHPGNQGDAVFWGEALGAEARQMGAYQGHGSVATPHGALIGWPIMMQGGIQVNALGQRFSNEHGGYSEQAVHVLAQPDGIAWNLYDERLHALGMEFADYRGGEDVGAIRRFASLEEMASAIGCDPSVLTATVEQSRALASGAGTDGFGRDFTGAPAIAGPPYFGVKVTGTLFHTQGGLSVDADGRVLRPDGSALANLFAGGGAAVGVSGSEVWGYLSGNGLLAATTYGRLCGQAAARLVAG
ncbi:MAG: FAD-dependent oxidoreductase [Rhodospirillaceae bacterium]|nr:FAD-dependent oxidoreductase [Rhodospirillaceae bacterium]